MKKGVKIDNNRLKKNVSVGIGLNTLNTPSVIVAYVVSVYRSTAAVKNIKSALTAGLLWTVRLYVMIKE